MSNGDPLILVIEDRADDALLIRRAFAKANIANPLRFLADGDAAVAYLAGEPPFDDRDAHPLPVVLLLDLKLPKRSGLEVIEWVRALATPLRRLPVVVLTSSHEDHDINRAFDLGANSYLIKPGDFDDLSALVRTLDLYWLILNARPRLEEDDQPATPPPAQPEAP